MIFLDISKEEVQLKIGGEIDMQEEEIERERKVIKHLEIKCKSNVILIKKIQCVKEEDKNL